jgi:hypothetical protein
MRSVKLTVVPLSGYVKIISAVLICVFIYWVTTRNNATYVVSTSDDHKYLVKNLPDKKEATDVLSLIRKNINVLINHLHNNIIKYPDQRQYIESLWLRTRNIIISENHGYSQYTTYTVNKGDEIVFCLRDKNGQLHDTNLLMFVAIHELSHIACPELNHTTLFITIFVFLLKVAMDIGIYQYQDYNKDPVYYCGMYLNQSPI